MLVLRDIASIPRLEKRHVFAIGNFDGVHRGHQVLIGKVKQLAAAEQCGSGIIVFEPHPREFFQPELPHFRLTPLPEKLRLLSAYGISVVAVLDFDARLAGLSPEAFIADVLVGKLNVGHVIVGYDFRFGAKRAGDVKSLEAAGMRYDFGVSVIAKQAPNGGGTAYGSSSIRDELRAGRVREAADAMGHWWRVSGTVEHGFSLGQDLGFPTANIALPEGTDLAHGIYAVRVLIGGRDFKGAAYFGGRPTVNTGPAKLEVFVLDFAGDLYGSEIAVEFVEFLRGDRRFEGLEALKAQIARDCEAAREVLATAGDTPVVRS